MQLVRDTILPLGLGFVFAVLAGLILVPWLKRLKIGQHIRAEGPKSHQVKAGTPTIGGLIFISGALLALGVYHIVARKSVPSSEFMIMALVLAYGLVGFIDDYRKVRLGRNLGLRAREKMALQILFAAVFMYVVAGSRLSSTVIVPFTGREVTLGMLYGVFGIIMIAGEGNAVNFTDGLDGLAAGTVVIGLIGFYAITLKGAGLLDMANLSPVILAWIGALLGFLVFNRHPAKVIMGDTGSLSLGALVAAIAILSKTELVLLFLTAVPVIEILSVMLQVASFQLFGKRIFKMSPLHHHFELIGWKETKVVLVFWTVAAIFTLLGLLSMAVA